MDVLAGNGLLSAEKQTVQYIYGMVLNSIRLLD